MGTMGPVSEETGLSLWDAMSVLYHPQQYEGSGGGGGAEKSLLPSQPNLEGRERDSPFARKSGSI